MAEYVTREGTVAAADTRTELNTQGSVAAPGAITAPSSRIAQIIVAISTDGTGVGAATWLCRIAGNGIVGGEQTITIGSAGGTLATSDIQTNAPTVIPVSIGVVKGKQVSIAAEMCGSDLGTSEVSVTLGFE